MNVSAIGSMFAVAFLFAAPAVAADNVYLSWSRCHGEGLGTQNRTFACDTNAGSEVLVCSFVSATDMHNVSGNEIVIDVLSEVDPLPPWWAFKDPGTCRQSSLGINATANVSDVVCVDWASGQSTGGIGAYNSEIGTIDPSLSSRHRRLKIALAVPFTSLATVVAGTEYYACNIIMDHAKTVGSGACGGCAGSVCLYLQYVKVTTINNVDDRTLDGTDLAGSIATWQGSGANCLLVPVKNATWGQVKALYR
jgi:hypothetical protein